MPDGLLGQALAGLGGGGAVMVALKVLDLVAARRGTAATVDVSLSAEARQWVEQFRQAMEEQAARHSADIKGLQERHAVDIAGLQARLAALETQLVDREARVRTLEGENARLEREVHRLTERVRALEGAPKGGKG